MNVEDVAFLLNDGGGTAACRKGRLRGCGDPEARLREDPLRCLRAVRFAAAYGLSLDEATAAAVRPSRSPMLPCRGDGSGAHLGGAAQDGQGGGAAARGLRPGDGAGGTPRPPAVRTAGAVPPDMQGEGMGRGPPAGEDADQDWVPASRSSHCLPTSPPASALPLACPQLGCVRVAPEGAVCGEVGAGVESDKYEALGRRLKMSGKELKSLLTLHRLNRLSKEEASGPAPRPLDWARFYAEDSAADCLEVAAALLGEDSGGKFRETHAQAQEQFAMGIERARANRKVVTAADLKAEGIKPGPRMGALIEEAEALAVSQGLDDVSAVLNQLRSTKLWPTASLD
eukprot:jgi/Botrbrau1/18438/Bobra.0072s0026.1